MKQKIDPRIHIGKQFGIYKLEDILSEKDKSGHYVYKGVCQKCGHERFATYSRFKNSPVEKCTHIKEIKIKTCLCCGKEIPIENLKLSEYNKKKFCSHSCSATYNNGKKNDAKLVNPSCLNCGSPIKFGNKYCSHTCQNKYQQKVWEEKWLSGEINGFYETDHWGNVPDRIRTYLFNKFDSKCSVCGWGEINPYTGRIPLEVEHIDGDHTNNRPENVTLLCPNCHSLTKYYRGANKGKGRGKTWVPKQNNLEIEI